MRGSARDEAEIASDAAIAASLDGAVAVTPASQTADEIFGERWASFCDRWSQLTFFLLDANGWRGE